MDQTEYRCNEVIFYENDNQNWMYSICEGEVDIYSGYGTAEEKKLTTLTKGQFFGEIGMIAGIPRTATAVAAEKYVVLEQISSEDFEDYLKQYPENLLPIMSSISGRLRAMTADLAAVTQMTNKILRERDNGNRAAGWLTGSFKKLLSRLKNPKVSMNEIVIQHKRQQRLTGELPPVIRLCAGDVIFHAGEAADCMYHIYDGCVGIYSDYRTENEKLLAKLQMDDVFGEMGILDDMPRSATAVCMTDCAVLLVKQECFMQFFRKKPEKVLHILQKMCLRLRELTKTYLQVCKTLEELPVPEESNFREDEALAELDCIRQSSLCIGMYNIYGYEDWMREHI